MGPCELKVSQWIERTMGDGGDAEQAVRRIVLEVWGRIIVRSPVDTGRFRANWIYSVNATVGGVVQVSGTTEAPAAPAEPPTLPAGQVLERVHFIQNNLPYARRLEDGYSSQAPTGMVALTLREFAGIADEAARSVHR